MEPKNSNSGNQKTSKSQSESNVSQSSPVTHKQSYMEMWDTFEHILMFISMYILAGSIGMFLHYYVDKLIPPVVNTGGFSWISYLLLYSGGEVSLLPMLMASLVVTYPIFAFLFLNTKQRALANPLILNHKTRKIFTYLTLIGTFLFILLKIINLIYGSFTGNASLNFLVHFLVTVGISGFIFAYYMLEVRKEMHT